MKRLLFVILLFLATFSLNAQQWRFVRHEVNFGVGVSNFLGDLGGAKGIGTHYFKDLRGRSTRPAIELGYKFTITPAFSVKTSVVWGYLNGDDATTKNLIRNNRNLHFRSMIGDWSVVGQWYPWEERISHRYKISGIYGNRTFTIMPYVSLGMGMTMFNPKAKYNGNWVALQPLHTEGQGMMGRPEPYKRITMNFPIGIGAKYLITSQWSLGFELSVRYTLSDYIDDVSTTYYKPGSFTDPVALELQDRSLDPNLGWTGVTEFDNGLVNYKQRGNPNYNDAYMFAIFSVHYRFTKGQTYIPKF
ncbi:DUF6089 family protein [Paracrocinitomix mangrovi]|uniref:DUF6089 family protein n=1 Tax=Paracrocinitomix mangrovi TaxID=2862509 RepID=UPI001C8DEDA4|nr:DUF6089 family protein [Paracrocinitomix mangrovi]UKN03432.1 DUF6089 family protein [Paracrocinitomix mangrovi]